MSVFVQNGDRFSLAPSHATIVHDKLPVGIYNVNLSPMGYFLERKDDAIKPLPARVYGTTPMRGDRILRTFAERRERGEGTGVLFSGEKGSGKSLLGRYLMDKVMERMQLPVVIVQSPFSDRHFLDLLTAGGDKMVFFDEFEKVYKSDNDQNALLSMLDGHYNTRNLTVATVNDAYRVIDPLKNRPSRFYYHYRYTGLDRRFVEEYCKERLNNLNTEKLADVYSVVDRITNFNFDMLQVLVEEMNRFGDTAEDCMLHVNIVPPILSYRYAVKVYTNDNEPKHVELRRNEIVVARPDVDHLDFYLYTKPVEVEDADGMRTIAQETLYFSSSNLVGQTDKGAYILNNGEYVAHLTPEFNTRQWAI